MKLDIVPASRADLDEVSAFQRRCFAEVAGGNNLSETQTADYYRWKYISPYGEALLAQVRIDGNLVAMNGVFPAELSCADKTYRGWQSCDTATAPEGRGKGYFLKCLGALKGSIEKTDAFFGFPNANSAPGFAKFGWSRLSRLRLFAGLLGPSFASDPLPMLTSFSTDADAICANRGQTPTVAVRKTARYLNHRYMSPLRPLYACIGFGVNGYVIVRVVELAQRRMTLIMEMQATSVDYYGRLIAAAKAWGRYEKCLGVVAINNRFSAVQFMKHGMLPVPDRLSPRPIVLMADTDRFGATREWDCQIGDWDGF